MLFIMFIFYFFFHDTATTEIYTLSLHDALPISKRRPVRVHEFYDRARTHAEPRGGFGAEPNPAPALAVELSTRDDPDVHSRRAEPSASRRSRRRIGLALSEHDPVERLRGAGRDVSLAHVGCDPRGVALERIAEATTAARLHQQHVAGLERECAHLAG